MADPLTDLFVPKKKLTTNFFLKKYYWLIPDRIVCVYKIIYIDSHFIHIYTDSIYIDSHFVDYSTTHIDTKQFTPSI